MQAAQIAIRKGELLPLSKARVQVGERKFAHPVVKDLEIWFQESYHEGNSWDQEGFHPLKPRARFGAYLRTTLEEEWNTHEPVFGALDLHLGAEEYGEEYNVVTLSCTLMGKSAILDGRSQVPRAEEMASLLDRVSRPLIKRLAPAYALITDNHYNETRGREVLEAQLKFIHWFNYFGAPYVDRYGKALFLDSPAWRKEMLDDLGALFILGPRLTETAGGVPRQDVRAYFRLIAPIIVAWGE